MSLGQALKNWLEDRRPEVITAVAWSLPMAVVGGAIGLWQGWGLLGTFAAMIVAFVVTAGGALLVSGGAGSATEILMQHRGSSTPSLPDYSYEKSLVARGQVAEAIHCYERHIAERPEVVAPFLLAADLYVGQGDYARAEALLKAARRLPAAKEPDRLRATNSLVDLYLGPLDRPDDARSELRYLVETFPTSQAAIHGRTALARLRGS